MVISGQERERERNKKDTMVCNGKITIPCYPDIKVDSFWLDLYSFWLRIYWLRGDYWPCDVREPLCSKTGPLQGMSHDQVVQEWCVFLPYFVLFIDHPLLHCIIKATWKTSSVVKTSQVLLYSNQRKTWVSHMNNGIKPTCITIRDSQSVTV